MLSFTKKLRSLSGSIATCSAADHADHLDSKSLSCSLLDSLHIFVGVVIFAYLVAQFGRVIEVDHFWDRKKGVRLMPLVNRRRLAPQKTTEFLTFLTNLIVCGHLVYCDV